MKIQCVWQHNWRRQHPGFMPILPARLQEGNRKMKLFEKCRPKSCPTWRGRATLPRTLWSRRSVQEKASALTVSDADSDVLFNDEKAPLTAAEYEALKSLAMKSARDFLALYRSIPDKDKSALAAKSHLLRGDSRTAREMYKHTRNVNTYYFGEIGVQADNNGTIAECRERGYCSAGAAAGLSGEYRFCSEATTSNGRCERCCADSSGTTGFTPRQCTGWR